jgi:hypothetical protein
LFLKIFTNFCNFLQFFQIILPLKQILRQRSLERLSRIPAILRKNRPKKTKPEPIIFQNAKTVKNEPYSNWESENQKSKKKPPYSYMAMIEVQLNLKNQDKNGP